MSPFWSLLLIIGLTSAVPINQSEESLGANFHAKCNTKFPKGISRKDTHDGGSDYTAPSMKWPTNTVFYSIMPEFDEHELEIIREAMREISKETCVQFQEKLPDTPDYVQIIGNADECSADLGKVEHGGPQSLLLGPGCRTKDTVIHELLHTLGFIHEHNRKDRNDYVNINWCNIKINKTEEFEIPEDYYFSDFYDYKIPYDYLSIMHYEENAFAKSPGLFTIMTLNPKFQHKIGRVPTLSAGDIQKIRSVYPCDKPQYEDEKTKEVRVNAKK